MTAPVSTNMAGSRIQCCFTVFSEPAPCPLNTDNIISTMFMSSASSLELL